MHGWDATQYLRFADERTRPALDLLARLDLAAPRRIVDLGCGPGNSTGLLRGRWPEAVITGLDSSADMLDAARRDHPGIDFVTGDIAAWIPAEPYDLVFSIAMPPSSPRRFRHAATVRCCFPIRASSSSPRRSDGVKFGNSLQLSSSRRRCLVPGDWHYRPRLVQAVSFLEERLASCT
jgi:SAM-dependent methyltransferase